MKKNIDIGRMLKEHIEQNKLSKTAIAQRMGVPNSTIYSYENRQYIYTQTLFRICEATQHNFFMDIANLMPKTLAHNPDLVTEKDQLIAEQAAEINQLKLENNLMKELIKGRL